MPHRTIRVAIAVGIAATALAVPAPTPTDAIPAEVAPAAVPAVNLLAGTAPGTITRDQAANQTATATLLAAICAPDPCPAPGDHLAAATFAAIKQPHPSVDQHATPAGGPSAPALLLLDHIRPRSALPAGRATHLDPRPA